MMIVNSLSIVILSCSLLLSNCLRNARIENITSSSTSSGDAEWFQIDPSDYKYADHRRRRQPIFSIEKLNSSMIFQQDSRRRLLHYKKQEKEVVVKRQLATSHSFQPLACNGHHLSKLTTAICRPWSSMNFNVSTEEVIIPCGICVTMAEFTQGEKIVLRKGINVEGRWHFPPTVKISIETTHIFVQGKFTINSQHVIHGPGTERIKILMTGNEDQLFMPHTQNSYLCGGEGYACNVGPKAIVVAGGQVDIVAMKNGCPSWVRLANSKDTPTDGIKSYTLDANIFTNTWQMVGNICNNLAATNPTYYWPYSPNQQLEIVQEEGNNFYYKIYNRNAVWSSLSWNLNSHCVVPGYTYTFKSQVRLLSMQPDKMSVHVKIFKQHLQGEISQKQTTSIPYPPLIVRICDCPNSSIEIGWVQCLCDVTFSNHFVNSDQLQVFFSTSSDTTSEVHYKDISFLYKKNAPAMSLASAVEQCWGTGAEVAFTSQTFNNEESQVQRIVSNSAIDGLVFTGTRSMQLLTTERAREQATEIILMNRNIVFQTEVGSPAKRSAHFMVLNTPHVEQRIEGVAFVGFGQDGVMGRYPINFHMCGSNYASIVSKNLITASKNRCIVMDGTNGVVISHNAAYDTIGHCFTLEGKFL